MPSVFSDEVLDQFLVSAQYEELPEALASRFMGVADRVTLTVPNDPANDAAVSLVISAIRARTQSAAA
ncbi:hypothetical protein D3C84_1188610 [compost metagenome]